MPCAHSDERNYHVFYQLIAGATPAERAEFRLEAPEKYRYLNMGGVTTVPGTDDAHEFSTGMLCRRCCRHRFCG
jgi:myosin heavy subunit